MYRPLCVCVCVCVRAPAPVLIYSYDWRSVDVIIFGFINFEVLSESYLFILDVCIMLKHCSRKHIYMTKYTDRSCSCRRF
jgi:hypothetical protein